jgi:hypothetical protein
LHRNSKWRHLLQDEKIRRWSENVVRGSKYTGDVYLQRLGRYCDQHGVTPHQLSATGQEALNSLILDTVTAMESSGLAGSYVNSVIKAIKSWLAFNGRKVTVSVKITGTQETPTLRNERSPTQEELRAIFNSCNKRSRVICALMAHSGLRPEVLGCLSRDGITVSDVVDMEIRDGKVAFKRMSAMQVISSRVSKAGHQHFTFLTDEGCAYLKEYLEERMRKGETLSPDSPIVAADWGDGRFISAKNVSKVVRQALRKAGFAWRPYVLRTFFDTEMMLAESKGRMLRDYGVFMMGHKGDIEHRYTLNRLRLPEPLLQDLWQHYAQSQKFLQTTSGTDAEDLMTDLKTRILTMSGYSAEEVRSMGELSDKEVSEKARERLMVLAKDSLEEEMRKNGLRQKVVENGQVAEQIRGGWEFVAAIPGTNQCVVKLPIGGTMTSMS